MKLILSLLLTIFGVFGIFDAGFIVYGEVTGNLPPCQPPFQCRTVLDSPWAHIGPLPLAAYGMMFYFVMLILGMLSVLEIEKITIGNFSVKLLPVRTALGVAGFLFSMWLVFLMGVILKAWCLYCLLSAINCFVIFILTTSIFLHESRLSHRAKSEE